MTNFTQALDLIGAKYPPKVIYDIGAHKGEWTAEKARKYTNVEFHMFEANPQLKDPLIGQIWHQIALSNESTTRTFYTINGTGDSFYKEQSAYYSGSETRLSLQTFTLDTYAKENNIPPPDAIKIDTQGSELDILNGAMKRLQHCKLILCEIPIVKYNTNAPRFDAYIDFFSSQGFVPIGPEEIHIVDKIFIQIDIIFVDHGVHNELSAPKTLSTSLH